MVDGDPHFFKMKLASKRTHTAMQLAALFALLPFVALPLACFFVSFGVGVDSSLPSVRIMWISYGICV